MTQAISSFSNPLVKRIKRLRQKKYRRREEAFFVEGLRVVLTAVEAGAPVETLIYCPTLLTSDLAWAMLRRQEQMGRNCQAVTAELFTSISGRDHPAGLGAIVRTRWTQLEDIVVGPEAIFVALFETSEPGNLGTILRTIDAVGAQGALLIGDSVDPFHPSAVKASMGAVFSVDVARIASSEALFHWAKQAGLQTIATSAKAIDLYSGAPYRLPALLLLGSEGDGLPRPIIEAADMAVTIPMAGHASSLNLAVAAGLLLYEIRRSTASQKDG
ncbi:MAG: TrmH family RNA methyltransferase [Candidatus Promineifilaceae bacterium]|jgi:TrmH family RNA methyltransferase